MLIYNIYIQEAVCTKQRFDECDRLMEVGEGQGLFILPTWDQKDLWTV